MKIEKDAFALQYVQLACGLTLEFPNENKTVELCIIAVQSNALTLQYVPNRIKTVELCMIAVQSNPLALQFVDGTYLIEEGFQTFIFKTYDMCKLAVQNNYCALQYVQSALGLTLESPKETVPSKFQTEEIINIALQSNYTALKYIDKDILTDHIIDLAFQYKTKQDLHK